MSRIAFIGVGRMGVPMVDHLLRAGHEVRAFDASPAGMEAAVAVGADAAASLPDCVRGAEFALTSLPGPDAVREVYLGDEGILRHCPGDAVVMDTSTSSPSLARELEAAGARRGVAVLDTPVSGGPTGAQAGTLAIMVGGARSAFERVEESVLLKIGSMARLMGSAGAGQSTKLVNNLLAGVYMTAIAEAMTLAQEEGLDPEALFEVLTSGTGDSRPLRTRFPIPGALPHTPASNDWEPMFPVELIRKDMALAVALAEEAGVEVPAARYALGRYDTAIEQGWGGRDYSIIVNLVRGERLNVSR